MFLTTIILIFTEFASKILTALRPGRLAFPGAYVLTSLPYLLHHFVWFINKIVNGLLFIVGVSHETDNSGESISSDELRTVVHEAGNLVLLRHQRMLIRILDLENVTVEDIMWHCQVNFLELLKPA